MRLICCLFFLVFAAQWLFSSGVSENRKGNKAFKKDSLDTAIQHYKQAEIEAPEEKGISYNLGNALYKKKDYEQAAKSYERALTSHDKKLRKKALFNEGNNYYRQGSLAQDGSGQEKLNEAIKRYKQVLKLDPQDQAAKFNLQKTLQMIEQQKQQQNQQNKDNKDQQNKDQQNQQGQQNQQDQKNKDKQDKDKKEGDNEKKEQDKKDPDKDKKGEPGKEDEKKKEEQKGAQAGKPGEMSPEEAKRLLEAVKQDEKELQKKRLMKMMQDQKLEKDW